MTSSNGNIFRVTGPLRGEFTDPGEFPTQRPVTRSFDVFFDLRLNKRLSKQPWGWWFETPSWSLWRQCNVEFTPKLSWGHLRSCRLNDVERVISLPKSIRNRDHDQTNAEINMSNFYSQHCACWWPGTIRCQVICSYIDGHVGSIMCAERTHKDNKYCFNVSVQFNYTAITR